MTDLATANRLSAPELAILLAGGMTPAELPRGFVRREARLAEAYELLLKPAGETTAKPKAWVEPPAFVPVPKVARVRTGRVRCEAA